MSPGSSCHARLQRTCQRLRSAAALVELSGDALEKIRDPIELPDLGHLERDRELVLEHRVISDLIAGGLRLGDEHLEAARQLEPLAFAQTFSQGMDARDHELEIGGGLVLHRTNIAAGRVRRNRCAPSAERPLHPYEDMAALQNILVPVDGSSPSLAALAHAIALAEDAGAHVDVLHVDASGTNAMTLAPDVIEELSRARAAAVERAHAHLGDQLSVIEAAGDPLRVIIEQGRAGRYDLVVLGTHGRIGRIHALLGSVAEGVVRNAPCPVLTVREPGEGYQSFAERRHGRPSIAEQPAPPAR